MKKPKLCAGCKDLRREKHKDGSETVHCDKLKRQLRWYMSVYEMEKPDARREC